VACVSDGDRFNHVFFEGGIVRKPDKDSWVLRLATGIALLALVSALAACGGTPEEGAGADPAAASPADDDPDRSVAGGGTLPEGWNVRIDEDGPNQGIFEQRGDVYHFEMGAAGTFYRPDWTKSGDFGFSARLTQLAAPSHSISYGLMFGGSDLEGPNQTYTYFLVRNRGQYFIANREGAEVEVVTNWTAHDAISAEDPAGRQANVLGIQVQGDQAVFTVNGTEVTRLAKSAIHTDGVTGFRIGHNIDVDVDQVSR
jgi:hypothetical protein